MAESVDLAKLVVRMEAQSAKYLKDLDKQKAQTKKWQNSVNKNVGSVAKTFRGLAAAAGVGLLTKKIVSATAKQQNAIAQLAQGWKTTGGVVGRSVDEIVAKAARLQDVSIFGDEQIIEAQSQLITFTNIVEDQFDRATIAAMDLSTRMGTDLKSSVLQLGKALNDPVTGMTALTRSGVTFTESQKEMVRALVDSGRSVEAQQLMLAELEKQFGGSAKAARETFGGALSGLSGAFNDLLEGGSGGGLNQNTRLDRRINHDAARPDVCGEYEYVPNSGDQRLHKAGIAGIQSCRGLGKDCRLGHNARSTPGYCGHVR